MRKMPGGCQKVFTGFAAQQASPNIQDTGQSVLSTSAPISAPRPLRSSITSLRWLENDAFDFITVKSHSTKYIWSTSGREPSGGPKLAFPLPLISKLPTTNVDSKSPLPEI